MAREKKVLNVVDGSRSITATILLLAWPVLVEQIFTTLVSYADTAMVGSLGKVATAAVSISNPVIMLLNGIVMALGVGITALVARAVGAGEKERVSTLIKHAILAIIILGVPITVIIACLSRLIPTWMGAEPDVLNTATQYNLIVSCGRIFAITSMMLNSAFRGYGDTKTPLYVNTAMNIVNVIFNFFLIYPTRTITLFGRFSFTMWGAGLEVAGAAIATAIGMAVGGLMALRVAFSKKNEFHIERHGSWKLDPPMTKQILKISFPAMLERILMSSSGIFTTSSIATLGTAVVAANSLCLTAESMSFMPAFAFQTAITTLVGQSLGANKPDLAVRYVRKTLLLGSLLMVLTSIGLFVLSHQLIGIFTPDAEVIQIGGECMKVVAFMQVPQVIMWTFSGVLRGGGDTKFNFYITAAANWLIRTPFSILAVRAWGMGLFEVQIVTLIEIFVMTFCLYLRYRSGRWKTIMLEEERKLAER